ncbi:ABC transporter substrate-binding protein [Rhodovastum atsumiense]|uniref:ABC transporter substrate-binding protein n=1 Tax=Rhodovastum atsumiense TaxID=504468 RepID=A0A5M6IZ67_9PROT|nr:ABC transporter substrate-binding protein [Rhodovastum atsumiense]KAA5613127.1 ABC transporter substrate-binding protein [Rhodovastum atsumiense]CAH2599999.1 ABC transporter substrate-binding protein [Rhodovastum atsumiense]
MALSRRVLLGTAAAATTVAASGRRARAQANTIKIGVLNDQSGPYRDVTGQSGVAAVRMAVEEFGAKGFTVEVISADHQNKPDLGASIAAQWYDNDNVDLIIDVPTSSVALAVAGVAKQKDKLNINNGAATAALTGSNCAPSVIHYTYDTYMLAKSTGGATVKAGGTSWYFITADYAFGKQLQADTSTFVTAAGGKVLGSSTYPFPGTSDFSSFLLQAQASGAKVLGLCNAGADTVNSIKQANEFGLTGSMTLAAMLMYITDVHALGLPVAKGLRLTESFYWDLNDRTRAFTKRFLPRSPNNWPNMSHAGNYSATLHFLKAVSAMGVAEAKKSGSAIATKMKSIPVDDDAFGKGSIRQDGRGLFNAYLFEVKSPAQSKGPWDYYKLIQTTPPDQAWRPLADGHCYYVKA